MVKTPLLNALEKLAAHVLHALKCQIKIFCGFIYCLRQLLTKLFFKEWEHGYKVCFCQQFLYRISILGNINHLVIVIRILVYIKKICQSAKFLILGTIPLRFFFFIQIVPHRFL